MIITLNWYARHIEHDMSNQRIDHNILSFFHFYGGFSGKELTH